MPHAHADHVVKKNVPSMKKDIATPCEVRYMYVMAQGNGAAPQT